MAGYDTDPKNEGPNSDEENEGWGQSLYNNGKGLKMTLLFTSLLAPLEAGKRCRANAKPPVTTNIEYFHEDFPLRDFVIKALDSVKHTDLFGLSWILQGHELDTDDCFTLSYTIPQRVTDQVIVSNEKDYNQMIDEITSKSPFEVKVFIVENKTGGGEDNSEEDAEHDKVAGSWKKQKDGKIEGVDQENPPYSKMFDPPSKKHHTDDIVLLAKRRMAQNRDAAAPAITVIFPGFADIFRAPNEPPLGPAANPAIAAPMNSPRRHVPPPPMELADFCHQFKLSNKLREKLDVIHIAGPHVLRLVSDTDLCGDGGLSVGELASVCDAQQQWIHALAHPA